MANEVFEIEEEIGFMDIKIPATPERESFTKTVDIIRFSQRLSKATEAIDGDAEAYADALSQAFHTEGFPPMSHLLEHKIALKVWSKDTEVQKKSGLIRELSDGPLSPGSTESTPSE